MADTETQNSHLQISNRILRLDHEWVQVLINLRMKYAKSFTGKRNSANIAWNHILKEMIELGAPKTVSQLRLKKKWMNLVAKYKQLKGDADISKQRAWPYFEQIDRAYSKKVYETQDPDYGNLTGCDGENNTSSESENRLSTDDFTKTLIGLRYKHRNIFTGKCNDAQQNWRLIQDDLPSGFTYSVDQMIETWNDLVQTYKALIENESDCNKITWKYFDQIHQIMLQIDTSELANKKGENNDVYNSNNNTDVKQQEIFLFEDSDNGQRCSTEKWSLETSGKSSETVSKPFNQKITSLDDVLEYLKARDIKRDEQMKEMQDIMRNILSCLKQ